MLRQPKPCSCATMDIPNWFSLCSRTIRLGRSLDDMGSTKLASSATESCKLRWTVLWRKFRKEKRKMFQPWGSVKVTYDPYSYSQNFDQGSLWDEPDYHSRSFSARYAVPSRIFLKEGTM
ncbi:hypothetical protein PVL29_014234 [Vitis rotundifolia]|uniref:Uncharacterized protein n=1 Tax=Vitis rotundifolia TaxID=103349 RepID=A0AA38ZHF2_VITRO|nr:hypothetical protein PVL29_014234 [Vitis rotundifolia]